MKPIILARLLPLIEAHRDRATYRVLAKGNRWALVFIRQDDRIDPADWERKAGE